MIYLLKLKPINVTNKSLEYIFSKNFNALNKISNTIKRINAIFHQPYQNTLEPLSPEEEQIINSIKNKEIVPFSIITLRSLEEFSESP